MRDAGEPTSPAARSAAPRAEVPHGPLPGGPFPRGPWREFRRARYALWCLLVLLVALGVLLHDLMARSPAARFAGTSAMVLLVAYPLGILLGFKCPRCGEAYLATGGLRDFLGLGRILWSRRCGRCALPAGEHGHGRHGSRDVNGPDLPDSRPAI